MQEHFETQKLGDTKKDNKSFLLFKKGKEILMRPKGLSLRWKPCIILGIAALHYIATGISITVSFGLGMSRFDSGTNPSLGEQALDILAHILVFPLVSATPSGVPQPIQFAMILLNSILWGCLLYLLAKNLSNLLSKLLKWRG